MDCSYSNSVIFHFEISFVRVSEKSYFWPNFQTLRTCVQARFKFSQKNYVSMKKFALSDKTINLFAFWVFRFFPTAHHLEICQNESGSEWVSRRKNSPENLELTSSLRLSIRALSAEIRISESDVSERVRPQISIFDQNPLAWNHGLMCAIDWANTKFRPVPD